MACDEPLKVHVHLQLKTAERILMLMINKNKIIKKNVLATDHNNVEHKLLITFKPKTFNKGKLVDLIPIKENQDRLNKFKSWQVIGESFLHQDIYSYVA
jgi:hypothetical protein